jgi:hypothetical protein
MKNPFRKTQLIADWLDDREASSDARRLRQRFAPLVAAAEKKKDWTERDRVLSDWGTERDLVLDPVYARKGERLAARARKYGIKVPPYPTHYTEESDDWDLSNVYGFWLPTAELVEKLQREIRDEQRAYYEEFRKWATLGFALLGFALAFYSVTQKRSQPDPCQRNYYRADSGECVFALQKVAQPSSSVAASPTLSSGVPKVQATDNAAHKNQPASH